MEVVALEQITDADWEQLIDGEREPWGSLGESLEWGVKDHNLGLRNADGRLLAVAGAVTVEVAVRGHDPFEVVGLGSLFVTHSRRGSRVMDQLVEPLLALAAGLGPARAMLFCRAELVPVYRRIDFREIDDPVWVDQRCACVCMPLAAMWRPLRPPAAWPAGRAHVRSLPF